MDTNITLKITEKELERIIGQMPLRFKMKLVQRLEKETREQRWERLFRNIDAQFRKSSISSTDIRKEISLVRKSRHAKGRS